MAAVKGGRDFKVFLRYTESEAIPKRNPRDIQADINFITDQASKIHNVRFTRTGSIIFPTKDMVCAMNIIKTSPFLGMQVSFRIIWENISNRFLLFNIPVDIPLA